MHGGFLPRRGRGSIMSHFYSSSTAILGPAVQISGVAYHSFPHIAPAQEYLTIPDTAAIVKGILGKKP
jgi:hypothetical protein